MSPVWILYQSGNWAAPCKVFQNESDSRCLIFQASVAGLVLKKSRGQRSSDSVLAHIVNAVELPPSVDCADSGLPGEPAMAPETQEF